MPKTKTENKWRRVAPSVYARGGFSIRWSHDGCWDAWRDNECGFDVASNPFPVTTARTLKEVKAVMETVLKQTGDRNLAFDNLSKSQRRDFVRECEAKATVV